MGEEHQQTQDLIKETAKSLFFKKGYLKATTQEIADEAGVNRALIHYYFRSRDQLLEMLLDESLCEKKERVRTILSSDLPFREKIALYIDVVVDYALEFPFLEPFIISETARNPEKISEFCSKDRGKSSELIGPQLEEEIRKKRIAPISPEHFMVNLSAMCHYPLLAKSVLKTIHGMTEAGFKKFLMERKKVIYATIFKEEMPEVSLNSILKTTKKN
ncbi:MAG TPA: TetR/AcrR family transcriptional regulator [Ohtaekwangia sp.]|nr:TetR/AcrR family transcriptional regulator [Ohtaekwangia sp.]